MNARRHGFAMLVAVGMVGLMAVVLLGLTLYISADARRTDDVHTQAQLDQLLLAGAAFAGEHVDAAEELELPAELRERGATLSIRPEPAGDHVRSVITAQFGGRTAIQTLILQPVGDRWVIVDAVR